MTVEKMFDEDEARATAVRISSGRAQEIKFQLIPFNKITMSTSSLYRVKGLFPEQGTGVIWGAYGAFKSFWLFDINMHVVLDWAYRGRPVKKGPAVYCSFEGQDGLAKRKEGFVQAHMGAEHDPVPFFLQPLTLDLIKEHQQLIDDIGAQCPEPAIVNFDTMARSLFGDENSNKDVGEYFRAADAIREAFKCTVPIVHHSGHEKSHSRGATVLPSNADFEIKIEAGAGNRITATAIKQKDGPSGHQVFSRWEEVEIGIDPDGDPITSCVLYVADAIAATASSTRLSANQSTMLTILERAMPQGLSVDEWNEAGKAAGIGVGRHATLWDCQTALEGKQLVYKFNDIWKLVNRDRRSPRQTC